MLGLGYDNFWAECFG